MLKERLVDLLIIIMIIIILVLAYLIGKDYYLMSKDAEVYESTKVVTNELKTDFDNQLLQISNDKITIEESIVDKITEAQVDYNKQYYNQMKLKYKDYEGWIIVPGTSIDYPIMHTPDDIEYYLRRDVNGGYSVSGVPFVGYNCTLNPQSSNVLIYAHNMKNNTMFGQLSDYKDIEFYKKNPNVYLRTADGSSVYTIFAVMNVNVTKGNGHFEFYNYTDLSDELKYEEFINLVNYHKLYDTGITPNRGDSIITLITCDGTKNDRFIVFATKS